MTLALHCLLVLWAFVPYGAMQQYVFTDEFKQDMLPKFKAHRASQECRNWMDDKRSAQLKTYENFATIQSIKPTEMKPTKITDDLNLRGNFVKHAQLDELWNDNGGEALPDWVNGGSFCCTYWCSAASFNGAFRIKKMAVISAVDSWYGLEVGTGTEPADTNLLLCECRDEKWKKISSIWPPSAGVRKTLSQCLADYETLCVAGSPPDLNVPGLCQPGSEIQVVDTGDSGSNQETDTTSCSPSCALDVGCALNYELEGSDDFAVLSVYQVGSGTTPTAELNVQCGWYSQENLPSTAKCVNGAWDWEDTPEPDCLIESATCCLVRTDCEYKFSFDNVEWGVQEWLTKKDQPSTLRLRCGNSDHIFGGTDSVCEGSHWKDALGKTLNEWLDEGCDITVEL